MFQRNVMFICYSLAIYGLFYWLHHILLSNSPHSEYYSHSVFVPLLCAYLLYPHIKLVNKNSSSPRAGLCVVTAGFMILLFFIKHQSQFSENHNLSLLCVMAVTLWTGGLILFYGIRALQVSFIPLLYLTFMFPIPEKIMEKIIIYLQTGSANVAEGLFVLAGVPYAREGFVFHLPTLFIRVAKECSGIHSTIALAITGVFVAFIFLDCTWKRAIFISSIVPITILKNGLRIFVLAVLGVYHSEKILADGWLHRSGGILFFILSLYLLGVVLWLLGTERITPAGNPGAN